MTTERHSTPVDHAAEQRVVGSILLQPAVLDDLGWLNAGDFFCDDTRRLFEVMLDMHRCNEPIDAALVAARLGTNAWAARIAEIMYAVPVAGHAVRYASIVQGLAKARRIVQIAETAVDAVARPDADPDEVVDQVERDLAGIRATSERGEPVSIAEASAEAAVRIDQIARRDDAPGLLTGLLEFDEKNGGLHTGELVILAARPGVGKTSLALQVAFHNATRNRPVYFVSLEMSASELATRAACGSSGVSNHHVRSGRIDASDVKLMSEAFAEQSKAALDIHDSSAMTVHAIRRQVRKRRKRGLRLCVVDYLQLVQPDDRRLVREQQVARIVRALKETAREYELPILCLCQLNRQADTDEVPKLSQLRESGAIEQDADMVLFLSPHKPNEKERHNALLSIAKNRNGAPGTINLDWDASRTRFSCHAKSAPWNPEEF